MSWLPLLTSLRKRLSNRAPLQLTEALFLRLLGLVYVTSFASFWPQIVGLVGSHGISPAQLLLSSLRSQSGSNAFFELPTLFWFGLSDTALIGCCVLGCVAGLVMFSGYFTRTAAALCWVLYLSLVQVGQPFSNFQWDALLLEAGFLALFAGSPLLSWAYRFLLFRLMFESGIVKLTSHDPNWADFHALRYHFLTQPLPNQIAFYAYRLPTWILDSLTALTMGIELFVPFLLFAPKLFRRISVALLMLLQVFILLTGNYAFFNLLTLALCLWGLDDEIFAPLAKFLPIRSKQFRFPWLKTASAAALGLLMAIGAIELAGMLAPSFKGPLRQLRQTIGPFEIVNTYGLFSFMTTSRPEIVIEGSNDAEHWLEYSFPYKPGDLHRGLPFVAPYQPRLDWQMWFAALGSYQQNTWVSGLMYRLMTGDPAASRLLQPSPFQKPPKYMRALLYDYQFTTPAERARNGAVWQRKLLGSWFGPVSLKSQ